MLERAISNLVDNAVKYSPAGTPIEVTVGPGRVEVRDHGPGIAPEDQPYVFERFYRSTAARTEPGSGLGLAIVEQIVARHGGRAWASNSPEGGAVVGFQLPVTATSARDPRDVIDRSVTFAPTIAGRGAGARAASSMEEHRTFNPLVLGSSPRRPTPAGAGRQHRRPSHSVAP